MADSEHFLFIFLYLKNNSFVIDNFYKYLYFHANCKYHLDNFMD